MMKQLRNLALREKIGEKKVYNYINILHLRKRNEEKLKQ